MLDDGEGQAEEYLNQDLDGPLVRPEVEVQLKWRSGYDETRNFV